MVGKDGVTRYVCEVSIECAGAIVCGWHRKQAFCLFDIGIWVVPRFIRPLQSFSVRDFFVHTASQGKVSAAHEDKLKCKGERE